VTPVEARRRRWTILRPADAACRERTGSCFRSCACLRRWRSSRSGARRSPARRARMTRPSMRQQKISARAKYRPTRVAIATARRKWTLLVAPPRRQSAATGVTATALAPTRTRTSGGGMGSRGAMTRRSKSRGIAPGSARETVDATPRRRRLMATMNVQRRLTRSVEERSRLLPHPATRRARRTGSESSKERLARARIGRRRIEFLAGRRGIETRGVARSRRPPRRRSRLRGARRARMLGRRRLPGPLRSDLRLILLC
jgi:hypothetical protein